MPNKSIFCPVCKLPLQPGVSVCPDCKQDLSALIYLEHQSEILYNQGLSLVQAGEDEQAIETLKKALDLDKSNLWAALVLGKIYARRKEYGEAKAIWERAQQIYPESPELKEQLAALEVEVEAARDQENREKIEKERQIKDSTRRKRSFWMIQVGLAFVFGCAALAAYQWAFGSPPSTQSNGQATQVDIATLQAFQTAAVQTSNASSASRITPVYTFTPSAVPTSIPATATLILPSPTMTATLSPTVQDFKPLIEQAIGRDPSLAGLGLKFVQSGSSIYVTGEAPDIRTRYLIEVTIRRVAGVKSVDVSALTVAKGDISSPPSLCIVTTGMPGGKLYFLDGPDVFSKIIGVLTEGDVLSIVHIGDWYQVTTSGGTTGWVHPSYCKTK